MRTWLLALWFILQSDKGIPLMRLAEIIGVSQPTTWRMGHVLRLLVAPDHTLGGVIEIDEMYFGGAPWSDPDKPRAGRGRKGQPRTTKTPAMVVVQRPAGSDPEYRPTKPGPTVKPPECPAKRGQVHFAVRPNPMDLENILCQIQADDIHPFHQSPLL